MRSRAPSAALKRASDVTPGPMSVEDDSDDRPLPQAPPAEEYDPAGPLQEPQRRRSCQRGELRMTAAADLHAYMRRAAAHGDQPTPQSATPPRCTRRCRPG